MTFYSPFIFTNEDQVEAARVFDAQAACSLKVGERDVPIFGLLQSKGRLYVIPEVRKAVCHIYPDEPDLRDYYTESSGDLAGKIKINLSEAALILKSF